MSVGVFCVQSKAHSCLRGREWIFEFKADFMGCKLKIYQILLFQSTILTLQAHAEVQTLRDHLRQAEDKLHKQEKKEKNKDGKVWELQNWKKARISLKACTL